MSKPLLYVGCGLTHAPEKFKAEVEATKAQLAQDWDVMEFLGLTAGTDKDVFEQDIIKNVRRCDAFVAICDEPSTGLGYELAEANMRGVPVLATAHETTRVTRLVTGATEFHEHMVFGKYEKMARDVPLMAAVVLLPKVIQLG
jgi:nucleoside 2-deoxyribosyltransferase